MCAKIRLYSASNPPTEEADLASVTASIFAYIRGGDIEMSNKALPVFKPTPCETSGYGFRPGCCVAL